MRYHRGPGKERDPRGRAAAAVRTCLRCGQSGHTTSECPMPRSSTNSPSKRPATSQSVESMAVGKKSGMVIFQDADGHELHHARPRSICISLWIWPTTSLLGAPGSVGLPVGED